jgi:polyisoprenoid-binding protein YceI
MNKLILLLWLSVTCMLLPAQAIEWKMDPAGSTLTFIPTFEKIPVPGIFHEFDVRMNFDPEVPENGVLEVTLDVTSADMDVAVVNKEISGKDWFDYRSFPQARYRSTNLQHNQGSQYLASGTLYLKGVNQPVEVPFNWSSSANGATLEGELTLARATFGIGTGEWATSEFIGSEVRLIFMIKLRKVD